MCKFRFRLVHWIDPHSIEHGYACSVNNPYSLHISYYAVFLYILLFLHGFFYPAIIYCVCQLKGSMNNLHVEQSNRRHHNFAPSYAPGESLSISYRPVSGGIESLLPCGESLTVHPLSHVLCSQYGQI